MRALALALAFALVVPLATAGTHDYANPFQDLTGYNTQRKMARAPDGSLWSTHVEPVGGNSTRVVVEHEHGGVVESFLAPSAGRGDQARPTLALDARGRVGLAWTEKAAQDREVFFARLVERKWQDVERLSGGIGYSGFPSLAVEADGSLDIAWYGFDGSNYQTFYRHHDGSSWSRPEQLSSGNLDANNPSVVVDPEGGVHVAWYKDDGHRYQVWYAYKPHAEGWALPHRVSQGNGSAYNAALAVDAAGTIHMVWDELHDEGYRILHVTARPGGAFGPATMIASRADAGEYPAIAARGNGVLVAWATFDGRLMASDLATSPRALLGGSLGRLPSLRGPAVGDPDARLDLQWTQASNDTTRARHVALPPACDPFSPADACAPPGGVRPVPSPASPPALALALALALVLSRSRRMRS